VRLAGDPIAGAILHRAFGPTVHESCDEFLAILSGLSDDKAGSGGATSGRLTQPESDIRHTDRTSREIHAVHGSPHLITTPNAGYGSAPPAKLSTPHNSGGSA
jgi:hypothetical protein